MKTIIPTLLETIPTMRLNIFKVTFSCRRFEFAKSKKSSFAKIAPICSKTAKYRQHSIDFIFTGYSAFFWALKNWINFQIH